MKKEINSKSRRKWIAGGLAAFASIALLTTGFATWIVGVTQTSQEGNVTINVDTAVNKSLTLDAHLTDAQITIAEDTTRGDWLKAEQIEGTAVTPDFKIVFDMLTVNYGKSLDKKPTGIKFSIKEAVKDGDKQTIDNKIAAGANKFTTERGTGDSFTYFGFKDPSVMTAIEGNNYGYTDSFILPLTDSAFTAPTDENAETQTYKLTSPYEITFTWGSFFKYQAPTAFYDAMYKANYIDSRTWTSETIGQKTDAALTELNEMEKALDNKKNSNKPFVIVAQLVNVSGDVVTELK